MITKKNLLTKDEFFEKLGAKFDGVYGLDNSFSLITFEICPVDSTATKEYFVASFNAVGKEIANHLGSESDFFSSWDNNFFIYSTVDSKAKIEELIGFIASVLKTDFQDKFALKAGYGIYPYDAIDIKELLDFIRDRKSVVDKLDASAHMQKGAALQFKKAKATNMEIMNEVHYYMNKLSQHDKYLFEHSMMVAQSSIYFAKELALDMKLVKNIAIAALMHDVGYLEIPSEIINKTGRLTSKEWGLIKLHPVLATRNVLNGKSVFKEILPIIERHHEFMDGSGYPFGLKGEDIDIESQVLSMMDTYQAIITNRNYRRALTLDEVVDVFLRNAGIKWEESLVTIFCAIIGDSEQRKNLVDKSFSKVSEIFEII